MKKWIGYVSVVNVFGAIGYMLLVATWVFFVAIVIALALDPSIRTFPTDITQHPNLPSPEKPSLAVIVAGYAITGLMIAISAFIVVTLPYLVGKWGARMIRQLMVALKIPITKSQLFFTKSIVAVLPLVGLMIINFTLAPDTVTFAAMYISTVVLSALSVTAFLIQLVIARRLNIPADQTW
jgi:hypothetical protein